MLIFIPSRTGGKGREKNWDCKVGTLGTLGTFGTMGVGETEGNRE